MTGVRCALAYLHHAIKVFYALNVAAIVPSEKGRFANHYRHCLDPFGTVD